MKNNTKVRTGGLTSSIRPYHFSKGQGRNAATLVKGIHYLYAPHKIILG